MSHLGLSDSPVSDGNSYCTIFQLLFRKLHSSSFRRWPLFATTLDLSWRILMTMKNQQSTWWVPKNVFDSCCPVNLLSCFKWANIAVLPRVQWQLLLPVTLSHEISLCVTCFCCLLLMFCCRARRCKIPTSISWCWTALGMHQRVPW